MAETTLRLNAKDKASLGRLAGDRYAISINDRPRDGVTLDRRTDTLVISGDAKDAALFIPGNIATDPQDFIPRLKSRTQNPVTITGGGEFIAEEGTLQVAAAPYLKRAELTLELNKDMGPLKDGRLTENARILKYTDMDGQRRTVAVPEGGGTIQIMNPENDQVVYSLSGKDSIEKSLADLKSLQSPQATTQEKPFDENSIKRAQKAALAITDLSKNNTDTNRGDALGNSLSQVSAMAKSLLASKSPTEAQVKGLSVAIDQVITTADETMKMRGNAISAQDRGLASLMKNKFTELKTGMDAQGPVDLSASDMAALADQANVRRIPSSHPIGLPDGTTVTPSQGPATRPSGRTRSYPQP